MNTYTIETFNGRTWTVWRTSEPMTYPYGQSVKLREFRGTKRQCEKFIERKEREQNANYSQY